jgi:hypothetical protein
MKISTSLCIQNDKFSSDLNESVGSNRGGAGPEGPVGLVQ